MSRPTVHDTTTEHQADIEAIRQIIADIEAGFNTNNPDLLVEHLMQNATIVNVMGKQVSGWHNIFDVSVRGLTGALRDEYARYVVQDILFLRPDVAIAYKEAEATTANGEIIEGGQRMIALYVLVKEQGRWWVAARQNTMQT
jgi:uncharacterized protein (TIGR02246 family)